ncbi:DUF2207 domain-containing protein [Halobacillus halophilus]|uniref:DUF2207 domain-containing protein n=1 Tax=Halobacillus halophilus TaxID=1570 RepID=UPI001CD701B0|nr:DUF2207 domain-containing protein [Halobacillus halophilus]MCA1010341.1 DUF2207 domain-containing protein [Halobacillus halophilus]
MKKLLPILFAAVILLVLPHQALAIEYSIPQTIIEAKLQINGDVKVKEQHTYAFDGEFNGITRTLYAKEGTRITNVQAYENEQKLKVDREDQTYKMYRSGMDETITVDLTYLIGDGVEVYSDRAQFYWSFFDENNESAYENFTVSVHPPSKTEDVLALGYQTAYRTELIMEGGVVQFDMGYISSGENMKVRVAYPSSLFSVAPISDKDISGEILSEKDRLAAEADAKEQRRDTLNRITPYALSLFVAAGLLLTGYAVRRYRSNQREVNRQLNSLSFIPEEEMSLPATLYFQNHRRLTIRSLTAAILDLVRKGYVKQKSDQEFLIIHRNTDYEHEVILLSWLFDEVGGNGTFHFEDIQTYTADKSNHGQYQKDFNLWKKAVKQEVDTHNLYESMIKWRGFTALVGTLAILFGIYQLFPWMILYIILGSLVLVTAFAYHPHTVEGKKIQLQWKKLLHTGSDPGSLTDNEQLRLFLYEIGTGHRKVENEPEVRNRSSFSTDTGTTTAHNDMMLFIILAASLQSNFSEAEQTVSAAAAASANAGGGGAGVGGSGGGSGAF